MPKKRDTDKLTGSFSVNLAEILSNFVCHQGKPQNSQQAKPVQKTITVDCLKPMEGNQLNWLRRVRSRSAFPETKGLQFTIGNEI